MANICITEYRFYGDEEQLRSLYDTMNELEKNEEPFIKDSPKKWLANLVSRLGYSHDGLDCRGEWECLNFDGSCLSFYTESKWYRCTDVEDILLKHFSDISMSFRCEEPGCGIFETNDFHSFSDKFVVDIENDDAYYLPDKNAVIHKMSQFLKKELKSWEEMIQAIEDYEQRECVSISINEFTEIKN